MTRWLCREAKGTKKKIGRTEGKRSNKDKKKRNEREKKRKKAKDVAHLNTGWDTTHKEAVMPSLRNIRNK